REVFPNYDSKARIEYVEGKKTPVERLLDGEVDAIITDISDQKLFDLLENSPKVRRLFPNYVSEDEQLYRETGIYTPVHLMVMSQKLNRQFPNLARKLFNGFEQAKSLAYEEILSDRGGFSVVYLRERLKEQRERWGDPWRYGIKANKQTIDTFIQYNHEQGMIREPLPCEKVFAEGTLGS
ncbi:MAG TPA: hypothetical protein VFU31_18195, partial [Candidatus Binatia bacterium]|nr:hypothetical protein [Candidatus Binatia bacterium]